MGSSACQVRTRSTGVRTISGKATTADERRGADQASPGRSRSTDVPTVTSDDDVDDEHHHRGRERRTTSPRRRSAGRRAPGPHRAGPSPARYGPSIAGSRRVLGAEARRRAAAGRPARRLPRRPGRPPAANAVAARVAAAPSRPRAAPGSRTSGMVAVANAAAPPSVDSTLNRAASSGSSRWLATSRSMLCSTARSTKTTRCRRRRPQPRGHASARRCRPSLGRSRRPAAHGQTGVAAEHHCRLPRRPGRWRRRARRRRTRRTTGSVTRLRVSGREAHPCRRRAHARGRAARHPARPARGRTHQRRRHAQRRHRSTGDRPR